MDELKSLLSSGQTSVSARRSDGEPLSHVVGVAAAVVQLGTLELFFNAMPADSGMAFVKEEFF